SVSGPDVDAAQLPVDPHGAFWLPLQRRHGLLHLPGYSAVAVLLRDAQPVVDRLCLDDPLALPLLDFITQAFEAFHEALIDPAALRLRLLRAGGGFPFEGQRVVAGTVAGQRPRDELITRGVQAF